MENKNMEKGALKFLVNCIYPHYQLIVLFSSSSPTKRGSFSPKIKRKKLLAHRLLPDCHSTEKGEPSQNIDMATLMI